MAHVREMKTSIRRRFEFIEFQLAWDGSIGRKKLQKQFSISMQQATKDLNTYMDAYPGNMLYDPRQKFYVPSASFQPRLTKGDVTEYLMHLLMLHEGYREEQEVWLDSVPKFDVVSARSRQMKPDIFKTVLAAIRGEACLRARYISMSSDNVGPRTLMPHAIASDGHRWHMRAFEFEKGRYSDFVLSRIRSAEPTAAPTLELPPDTVWDTVVDLVLKADSALDPAQRESLEYEYGMKNGRLSLRVRQAMLFYYLRHYGFNPRTSTKKAMQNESSFHLKVSNIREIERCLRRKR